MVFRCLPQTSEAMLSKQVEDSYYTTPVVVRFPHMEPKILSFLFNTNFLFLMLPPNSDSLDFSLCYCLSEFLGG